MGARSVACVGTGRDGPLTRLSTGPPLRPRPVRLPAPTCPGDDVFPFTPLPGEAVTIDAFFTHAEGDCDLVPQEFTGGCGAGVAFSPSNSNEEPIVYTDSGAAPMEYVLEAHLVSGGPCVESALAWSKELCGTADALEPNQLPRPSSLESIQPGDRWSLQFWFRLGPRSSSFSNAALAWFEQRTDARNRARTPPAARGRGLLCRRAQPLPPGFGDGPSAHRLAGVEFALDVLERRPRRLPGRA